MPPTLQDASTARLFQGDIAAAILAAQGFEKQLAMELQDVRAAKSLAAGEGQEVGQTSAHSQAPDPQQSSSYVQQLAALGLGASASGASCGGNWSIKVKHMDSPPTSSTNEKEERGRPEANLPLNASDELCL